MHKPNNKGGFRSFISGISPKTIIVMNIFLTPLTIAFIYIGWEFIKAAGVDIIKAKDDFLPIFDYLLTSLVIVIGGSAILDISLREFENNSKK